LESLQLLAKSGSDLKARDIGNQTLLHLAAAGGSVGTVEYLLEMGLA
jgi:ankyrin repeat protein